MATIENPLWDGIVANPTKAIVNADKSGTVDKVANGLISFVSSFSPDLGRELAIQWDRDTGVNRNKIIAKALKTIQQANLDGTLTQQQVDQVEGILANIKSTSARATNRYQTFKANKARLRDLKIAANKANTKANAIANSLGEIGPLSSLTGREMERRMKNVSDIMKEYEKGNEQ